MDPQLLQLMQLLQMFQGQGGQQGQQGGMGGLASLFGGQQSGGATQDPMSALLSLINLPFAFNQMKTPYQLQLQAAQTAMNPSAMMARYGQFYRPLSQQLINNVTEAVGPSIASRGMSTSPGQVSAMLGQALAPDVMQEQSQAMNAAMGTLQQPSNVGTNAGSDYLPTLFNMGQTTGAPLNELLNYISDQSNYSNNTPSYNFGGQSNQPSQNTWQGLQP